MKTKKCSKCGIEKDFDCFHKHSKSKDGHKSKCKSCCTEYYLKNKQKYLDNVRKRQKTGYFTEYARKKREKDPEAENRRVREVMQKSKARQPACVYQIVNKTNGKIYIGETLHVELRWYQHKYLLRNNSHDNPKLQADFNKFGEETFEWSIIKEVDKDKETLVLEETKTIDSFLKQGKELYNKQFKISKEE